MTFSKTHSKTQMALWRVLVLNKWRHLRAARQAPATPTERNTKRSVVLGRLPKGGN
jgi:hypothetical protein